jgi:hypothetical protein
MRALKRWWKKTRAEHLLAPRRDEVAALLKVHLRLARPPRLVRGGGMGHDSNYFVKAADGSMIGVLRIVNPHKQRPAPAPDMPYVLQDAASRIAREASILRAASVYGLTPDCLWSADDALLASYVPLQPMERLLKAQPDKSWHILARAAGRMADLHRNGFTHMDASLANMLCDETMERVVFIDFEYAPAPHLTPAEQRVYDQLRLVESVYKHIPESRWAQCGVWIDALAAGLDAGMLAVKLEVLQPALSRVLADKDILQALSRHFR